MAFNPIDNKQSEKIPSKEKKYTGSVPKNNQERNDYGHGLAEDNEVKYLYFKDRKTYVPAKPFSNEPPEYVFEENTNSGISQDDVDFVPDFDTPPPEAYLNDAPGLDSIGDNDFWSNDSSEMNTNNPTDLSDLPLDFEQKNTNVSHETLQAQSSQKPVTQQPQTSSNLREEPKKSKYDYVKLESVPVDFLLWHMGAEPLNGQKNIYVFQHQEFSLDGQRWFNDTFKHGDQGAISLAKTLISIKEKLDPFKNSRILGGKACRYLEQVFKDYVKNYRVEPPIYEKKTNYKKSESNSNVPRPTKDKPFSYFQVDYKSLSQDEKKIYFNALDSLKFDRIAAKFGMDAENNKFTLTNKKGQRLLVTVDERTWKVKQAKQDKYGVGTLQFTALLLAFNDGEDFFNKDVAKDYRMKASRYLGENITEEDIDLEAFTLETMEVDKEDESYIFKLPYHRLNEEEKEKYFTAIENFPLEQLASMLGASDYEDGVANKWKFRETFMTENIHITPGDNQWKSWNSDGGGTGAISLMTYYMMCRDGEDYTNKAARKAYRFVAAKEIAKSMDDANISFDKSRSLKSEVFTMPIILEPKNPHVKEYLCEKRHLPKWVVQKQMNAGYLFAGYPAHWKEIPKLKTPEFMPNDLVWATFLTVSGQAAEMRGIARSDHNAKILAKGSEKDLGGFLTKAEPKYNEYTVCSFEAAIDSLSYHAIYPGRITQSCMGTEYKLAARAAADFLRVTAVKTKHSCCFDNDYAGIKATVRYFNHLKDLMRDEDLFEDMIEKQKQNPNFVVPDEILYKDFIQAYRDGRINMFELTVKDLQESLALNQIFYLDVLEDKIGLDAAKMFYQIASSTLGKDVVKQAYTSGQIKYMNVLPSANALEKNLSEITAQTLNKLLTNHNYYLKMPDIESFLFDENDESFNKLSDVEKEAEMSRTKKVLTDFYHEFEKQAGDKLKHLVDSGSVIYERKTLFKDWNEHLIYMKENHPEFAQMLADREIEFAHYSNADAPKVKPGKIKK